MTIYASSRHLLPMEFLLGCVCVAVGVAGGFGHGELHRALDQFDAADAWMWTLMIGGAAMIALAITALVWRAPSDRVALNLARARSISAALSFAAWLYAIQFAARFDGWTLFPVTTMLAMPLLACSLWSFWVNTKVRVALDPAAESPGLKYDRRHA